MKQKQINQDWLFYKDGCQNMARKLDLPHDAMLEEHRNPLLPNGTATGFFPGGKYVYEKTFARGMLDPALTNILEFEGVYMDSTVLFNGESVGGWVFGYTGFFVDITNKILPGENRLLVIVDNSKTPNSRWYSGSGIYRSVRLWTGGQAHILPDSVHVRTISTEPAVIAIQTESIGEFTHEILRNGEIVATGSGSTTTVTIPNAQLWSAETPALYTLRTILSNGKEILDINETTFGIRTLAWNAEQGFLVNGRTVKLKGGCVHHDHGILGACSYEKAEFRRVRLLKTFGYNAIRYSHNPAGKDFLKACDELGMYVIDESFDQWKTPQSAYDYALHFDAEWRKDVAALVRKDYNHPCVIMYCIGNEITDTGLPFGEKICSAVSGLFHQLDNTRPTMLAINSMLTTLAAMQAKKKAEEAQAQKPLDKQLGSKEVNDIVSLLPKIMASITPESLEALIGTCVKSVDIVGYNYGTNLYAGTHALAPDRVILSSETFPQRMAANWETAVNSRYVIGDFHWTAWDYLGESGVGLPVYNTTKAPFSKEYPCQTAACGAIDLTGYPESAAYYAATLWGARTKPYIGIRPVDHAGEDYALGNWRLTDSLACWTWPGCEGNTTEVEVYAAGDNVVLLQDGVSLGRKALSACRAIFSVTYHPGTLEAISYQDGAELARAKLATAGSETQLDVLPEDTVIPADGEAIVYVPVHIVDDAGNLKMTDDRHITVTVEGPGKLLAFGSGCPKTEESYLTGAFTSWHGRALAVIRSTGKAGRIRIVARSAGLADASAEIQAQSK